MLDAIPPLSRLKRVEGHVRRRFGTGLLFVVPILITYVVFRFIVNRVVGILEPAINQAEDRSFEWLAGFPIRAIAVVLAFVAVYLVGVIAATVVGRWMVRQWHATLERIPIIRSVYRIARQSTDVFSGGVALQASKVVLVECPRMGVFSMGLVTGSYADLEGETFLAVYIPTVPVPTSGFLTYVRRDQVIETALNFEDAMKVVISAGVLTEETVKSRGPVSP